MDFSMTIYHGSVKRMPGHILVKGGSLQRLKPGIEVWFLVWSLVERGPVPSMFWCHEGTFYYMSGRRQVYETDITGRNVVLFDPVCRQMIDHKSRKINFRLMEKVEWVFL